MSDHNYATKFNATKIKLVPIYTFGLWVLSLQELLETRFNCILWNKKAVLSIVKRKNYVYCWQKIEFEWVNDKASIDLEPQNVSVKAVGYC